MLPCNPLLASAQIVGIRERELVFWVVVPGEICEDGSSLEDRKVIAVMVHNGGNSSIGRVLCEPRLLLNVLADVDTLPDVVLAVRSLQFLEDNRGFVSVGGSPGK